jgi:NitT/TauT family transport system permease protein
MGPNLKKSLIPFLGPLILFLLWNLALSAKWVQPNLLPPPDITISYMVKSFLTGAIYQDLWTTILRTLYAFLIAAAVGVPIGVLLGSSVPAYRSVEFLIDFFRSTPSSALIPLFMLIFGISDINKVAIAAFAAVLVILFNCAYGVMNAKKTRLMAAKTMGIRKFYIFKDILIMESLPQTFVGLRTGVSIALVIVIVAEMFIGSENGLGHRIIDAQQVFNIKRNVQFYSNYGCSGLFVEYYFHGDCNEGFNSLER